MKIAAHRLARPPRIISFPFQLPERRVNGANPARLADCFGSRVPSSGISISSIQAVTSPIVTADHGQTTRGHHGGREPEQQDVALYYFGPGHGPEPDDRLDQLALAPTVLGRLGVAVPKTMKAPGFLRP